MTARNRLQRAREAVDEANGTNISNSKKKHWNQQLTSLVEAQKRRVSGKADPTSEESVPKTVEQVVQNVKQTALQKVLNGPAKDEFQEAENETPTGKTTKVIKTLRTFRKGRRKGKKQKQFKKDMFTREIEIDTTELPSQAIKIKWLDLQNAEWAESWPEDVYHANMGLLTEHTKYTMPHPDEAPTFKPREWIELGETQSGEDIALDTKADEEVEEAGDAKTPQKSSQSRFSFLRVSNIRNWFGGRADA